MGCADPPLPPPPETDSSTPEGRRTPSDLEETKTPRWASHQCHSYGMFRCANQRSATWAGETACRAAICFAVVEFKSRLLASAKGEYAITVTLGNREAHMEGTPHGLLPMPTFF